MVSEGGVSEAAVTDRTGCWWPKNRKCGELLYWKRFPLKLKECILHRKVKNIV